MEYFSSLHFCQKIFPVYGCFIPWINVSHRYGSFDTHIIDILIEILCHMAYAIKFHEMAKYGIL